MPLFQPKVISKRCCHDDPLPRHHEVILSAWAENLDRGIYDSETQNDGEFIQRVLIDVLGYEGSSASDTWTVAKNQPVGPGNVDAALGEFKPNSVKILAPFVLKGAKTRDLDAVMPGRNKSPVHQAWEYAMDAVGAEWVLVSNYREIRLYAVGYGRKNYETFDLRSLTEPQEYSRFMLLLSAENLLSGRTKALLEESEQQDQDVTRQLYADYSSLRAKLVDEIVNSNPSIKPVDAVHFGQKILDRILFIAFAEDTGLLPDRTLQQAYETKNPFNPQPIWANLQGLFEAIDRGSPHLRIPEYNCSLFASDNELDVLSISDDICEQFKKLGDYDFNSEVSVTILGHVFEQSVADIEELKARIDPDSGPADGKAAKRKREGIYYTPSNVTWLMVESTIGSWLDAKKNELGFDRLPELTEEDYDSIRIISRGKRKNQITYNRNVEEHVSAWESFRDALSSIRVLDPACGSGAFLIEAFDFLYREGQVVNNQLAKLRGGQTELIRWEKHLLSTNLFGVDINEESVEITKLSLWLKTANPSEPLTHLDENIRLGNSLIDETTIAGSVAFDWWQEFSTVMDSGGFDVVIGNPPYIDSEEMVRSGLEQSRDFISNTYEFAKGNWDVYIAFFERGFSLLNRSGELCFISPDKWISKPFGEALRVGVFDNLAYICEVGRGVFEDAKVDAILTKLTRENQGELEISRLSGGLVTKVRICDKSTIKAGQALDQLFSPGLDLIRKLDDFPIKLGAIAECQNACATSDTYVLKKFITDIEGPQLIREGQYKVTNTGTLDRYVFKWGIRPMTYLGDKYLCPAVDKQAFTKTLGATYVARAESAKIIIKGLTLLEGALDLDAEFIPGKSTLVIPHSDKLVLKFVAAIVNSKLMSLYIKEKNRSSSYNQGVNFKPNMLNEIPVSEDLDRRHLAELVDRAIEASRSLANHRQNFWSLLRADLGLSKLSRTMQNWPEISFLDFIEELQKAKVKLSVRSKAEWQSHFRNATNEALVELSRLREADDRINHALYAAYRLTEVEVDLVEDNS